MSCRIAFLVSAVACSALITGCGGGGGSATPTPSPTPTSTASPTPTPTPTPTPPPFTDFDFTKAFTATVANSTYAFAYFTPGSGGAEVWSDGSRRDGTSTITYAVSPESVSFVWPDGSTLPSFAAADRQTATPNLRTYRNGTNAIALELPFQHILRVSYEQQQPYTRETVPGTLRGSRVALFFNGVSTTTAITSNLTYTGNPQVVGGKSGTTPSGAIGSEPTTFTVTASDGKITGSIRVFENVGGTPTLRATLPISATLASNGTFGGTIEDTANAFTGSFVGSLAGPAREEVFLIFLVANADGRKFLGSLIAS